MQFGQGYAPPPKRPMSTGMVLLIIFGGLLGTCTMCGVVSSATSKSVHFATTDAHAATPDPSAAQRAAEAAKALREKTAVETFPQRKGEIAATLKKATVSADASKWMQASSDLASAETALATFEGTSIAGDKDFLDLETKAAALHKRVAPQAEKIAKATAAASAERELVAHSIVVSSLQLWSDYQANEIAADGRYKGQQVLVTGTVGSIDKGPFGGLLLRLATGNQFMPTTCDMESSEQGQLAQLARGEQVRVLCVCRGIVLGSPQLDDCTFR